jgi:hypothetical protein
MLAESNCGMSGARVTAEGVVEVVMVVMIALPHPVPALTPDPPEV